MCTAVLQRFVGYGSLMDCQLRPLPPQIAAKYKLKLIDFAHASMKLLVFDQDVVRCFYPDPSKKEKLVFAAVALGIGVICCVLCVAFPSGRHGIGFPLARESRLT